MEEDKRAEAMRKAIEQADEADAEKKSKKAKAGKKGVNVGGKEIPIPNIPKVDLSQIKIPGVTGDGGKGTGDLKDLGETAKRKAAGIWGSKNGRLIVIGVVALVVLIFMGNLIGGMLGQTQNVPLSYKITDSELSVYRNSSYGSGYAWDAYVEVLNTGTENIYLSNMAFRVQTDKGEAVMTDQQLTSFPAVLQPGEHGYIYNKFGSELVYEANTSESLEKAYPGIANGEVGLDLRVVADVNLSTMVPGNYVVDENSVSIEDGLYGNKAMTCNLTNDSDSRGSDLSVFFVTYVDDNDGDDGLKCSGITFTRLDALPPHATVQIRMDPLNFIHSIQGETVTSWAMYVY